MEQIAYREMAATEQAHWWFLARRNIIADTIKSFNLPPHSKILEVGAGTGGNLKLLQRFGDLSAVEMNDYARAYATQVTGVGVEYGFLPDSLPDYPHKFDLICMFDVLEHVEKDLESLKVLATRLNPGGRVLITVPAYPWMWTDHDVVLHHYRLYANSPLRRYKSCRASTGSADQFQYVAISGCDSCEVGRERTRKKRIARKRLTATIC
ncbi:class I SAM-dependent methyltransferase [Rhizobium sp. P32RR-XVIII]|uniref:class I SAM-dependent methyltransferase n=1 Tax=Rhizobium sp. P32RR-XVIII TaxID=2726738 RepID=UPI00145786E1|nr:class I SAM-dependent methyltransferase [Rhizobium sp. P32RR-XVIII]NLS08333.1 class I SAM-dependent methyltransferase [Rhizobium sp. P32RR-XVIII]